MLFISCQKLILFLRYLHFFPNFFGYVEKQRDKKATVQISKFTDWTTNNYNTYTAQYLKK